jgi:hypothetical protein
VIILKATSESLQITTSTTAATDFSVSYADITTTTLSPSTNEGKITTATTTTNVVAAPASSTQRQIKLITISNHDTTLSNAIVVQKLITSTTYNMTPTITLLPGETAQYMDGSGWIYYSATGAIKGAQTAAGSSNQIQFNNGGVLGGDADLTWNWVTNTLSLGTNPQIALSGVTGTPTAPAAGTLDVYSQAISGKMQLMKMGPDGNPEALQAALWQNNVVMWTPGVVAAGTGTWQGTVGVMSAGTNVGVLPTTTNIYTTERRTKIADAATANYQTGIVTEKMFFRGASAGQGGFLFVCRFGIETYVASTSRLFVGLSASTAAMNGTGADISASVTNTLGFGYNVGDTALTFMHVDGSTFVKETISGQPALAANNGYDAYIYCKPNDTTVYYRLDNANTGVTLIDTSITANLPVNTTLMWATATMSTSVATAGTIAIGVNRLYIETNR